MPYDIDNVVQTEGVVGGNGEQFEQHFQYLMALWGGWGWGTGGAPADRDGCRGDTAWRDYDSHAP